MPGFDFDGEVASHYVNEYVNCKFSRADAIRCLVIEGAAEDEATEFIDAVNAEAVSG